VRRVVALLVLLPGAAHADAIMPIDGDCPPGLEKTIRDHAEACVPRSCEDGCGWGADCNTVPKCFATRPVPVHRFSQETRPARIVVGLCDAERRCADEDARCRDVRQCEPDDPTPAWNARTHEWTGARHESSGLCAAGRGRGSSLALIAGVIALSVFGRRARSRRTRLP
jgi:hypothetical protein